MQLGGQFAIFAYMAPLLATLTGATPTQIGLVFGLYGVGGFLGNIIATRLVGSKGAYWTSLLSTSCLCAGALIFGLGAGFYVGMLAVALVAIGIASAASR